MNDFFEVLEGYCAAQGLPVKGALSEFAPGQFEVNLGHVDDVVQACDDALMFKRCVKAAARATGRRTTFMAKPFEDSSGNGLHVHMSLVDRAGRNVFTEAGADGETGAGAEAGVGAGGTMLGHVVWGLQQAIEQWQAGSTQWFSQWVDRCMLSGKVVQVQVGEHIVTGRCEGIAQSGLLLVRDETTVHQLSSGEVLRWQ